MTNTAPTADPLSAMRAAGREAEHHGLAWEQQDVGYPTEDGPPPRLVFRVFILQGHRSTVGAGLM